MFTACGKSERIVAFKLMPGDDVLEGIVQICEQYSLFSGMVIGAVGSLQNAVYKKIVYIPEAKYHAGYGADICTDGPLELIGMSGIICHADDGQVLPHIHIALNDGMGGHLCPGTKVAITVEGAIIETEGINMRKIMDVERNIMVFYPEQK